MITDRLAPLAIYVAAVLALIAAVLGLSYVLGQKHREDATGEPYESGIVPAAPAHVRLAARFYLVAMLFVIFDLEAVFLFAWAVSAREASWAGFWAALAFIGVLVAGLIYEWRVGALDWGPGKARRDGRA